MTLRPVGGFDPGDPRQRAELVAALLVRPAAGGLQKTVIPAAPVLPRQIPSPAEPETAVLPGWAKLLGASGVLPLVALPFAPFQMVLVACVGCALVGLLVLARLTGATAAENKARAARHEEDVERWRREQEEENRRAQRETAALPGKTEYRLRADAAPARLRLAYLPFALRPFAGGTVALDLSGLTRDRGLALRLVSDRPKIEALVRHIAELEPPLLLDRSMPRIAQQEVEGGTLPVPLYGEEGDLARSLQELAASLTNTRDLQVELPFAGKDVAWTTSAAGPDARPRALPAVVLGADPAATIERCRAFDARIGMDAVALGTMSDVTKAFLSDIRALTAQKELSFRNEQTNALAQVLPSVVDATVNVFAYASYNFYCAACNRAELDAFARSGEMGNGLDRNTRLRYDPARGELRCTTCGLVWEPSQAPNRPVAIHRFKDDIVFPAWDRLMLEHAEERRTIVRESEDRCQAFQHELDNTIAQLERDQRGKTDTLLREMRQVEAMLARDEEIVGSLNTMMVKYEKLSAGRGQAYMAECRAAAEEIRLEVQRAVDALRQRDRQIIEDAVREMDGIAKQRTHIETLRHQEVMAYQKGMLQASVAMLSAQEESNSIARGIREDTARTAAASERTATAGERTAAAGEQMVQIGQTTNAILRQQVGDKVFKRKFLGLVRSDVEKARDKNVDGGYAGVRHEQH